ncbi:MAG: YccF domain-containing protein [Clostridiaceae bacterium]|nr:YccF domain-containing protein [Clostridiaceae bacterium]
MRLLGNFIWIVFGGFIAAILWFSAGVICCLTFIGIPFGIQCFKIAGFVLYPFGRDIEIKGFGFGGLVGNVIWIIVLGLELCICHLVIGFLLCITIIGIPFGKQHFKLAKLSLVPFGARIFTKSWF